VARLTEYEGKDLIAAAGVAVPAGFIAESVDEAVKAGEAVGFPVALKAQVLTGGRGLSGGIRFASNPQECGSASAALFDATIRGLPVRKLLIEARAEIQRELYVGILSDTAECAPVMIVSMDGGVEIEAAAARDAAVISAPVDILRGAPVYWCLDLLRDLELPGSVVLDLARVMSRLYDVYRRYDCTLVEINPLALTPKGLVALDARIALDDEALFRHRELGIERSQEVGDRPPTRLEVAAAKIDEHDHRGSAHFVQIDPDGSLARAQGKVSIGFDGIGTGVSMAVMDELVPLGYQPMNFCDTSGNPTASKLYRITKVILAQPLIEGYVFASCLSSQQLDVTARGIIKAFKEYFHEREGRPAIPCVFSFRGAWDETAIALLHEHGIAGIPFVRILGRDANERDIATAFHDVYREWHAAGARR
jgi:succinyl-CoA synthetase beta subunit